MIEKERMTEYILDLIRIDSLSRKEKEIALKLSADMEELGAECFFDDAGNKVNGNTGNLIVKMKGNTSNIEPFFLSAHMDIVGPGEGVKPRVNNGFIKSDGTTVLGSDDKSGIAVIVEVVRTLRERDVPHGDIEIAFTICEEIGLLGAKHIDISKFNSRYGIVLDSSSPSRLVLRCPSAERLEFHVHGVEAHAGLCPENGINAIKIASESISKMKLGRIDHETTANIGIIKGGIATNIVPNFVKIVGEVRSHDEDKLAAQKNHMIECVRNTVSNYEVILDGQKGGARVEEIFERSYDRMVVPEDSRVVKIIDRAVKGLGHRITYHTSGGGCDANFFNQMGIECANLGTGMYELHTVNEYLVLEEFYRAAEIVIETIKL
ncbi:MAG TPA: M20/M25/M40 family metallo-hydrolase, partial [Thermodesulfobacteriota bacterium]